MSTHDRSVSDAPLFDLPVVPKPRMTEEEFVTWSFREDVCAEWVDGKVVLMTPVSTEHTTLFVWLVRVLGDFVERRDLGAILGSELFVRFADVPSRRLPDVFFVSAAREGLLRKAHFEGAPDMIIEIVSPESVARDRGEKYSEYEAGGVREYWVIDPMSQHTELYVLSAAQKYESVAEHDGWLVSTAVPGFRLKTEWLWPATRPKVLDAIRELDSPVG